MAGGLTVNEPTTVGSISKPMLIADSATSGYVLNYRGVVVGGANARTQISLPNNATTNVQLVAPAYDAGDMTGWVYIDGTTDLRFYIAIQFSKNGAGTDYNVSYQTSGDTPPAGFSVSYASNYVRMTLPSIAGYASASFNYALNAPAVGTNFPLSIDGAAVTSGTVPATVLPVASATDSGIVNTSAQTFAGQKLFGNLRLIGPNWTSSAAGSGTILLPINFNTQGKAYLVLLYYSTTTTNEWISIIVASYVGINTSAFILGKSGTQTVTVSNSSGSTLLTISNISGALISTTLGGMMVGATNNP